MKLYLMYQFYGYLVNQHIEQLLVLLLVCFFKLLAEAGGRLYGRCSHIYADAYLNITSIPDDVVFDQNAAYFFISGEDIVYPLELWADVGQFLYGFGC